jgi:hypothetical protein
MALEIGLWRVDSGAPLRVGALAFPLEARDHNLAVDRLGWKS